MNNSTQPRFVDFEPLEDRLLFSATPMAAVDVPEKVEAASTADAGHAEHAVPAEAVSQEQAEAHHNPAAVETPTVVNAETVSAAAAAEAAHATDQPATTEVATPTSAAADRLELIFVDSRVENADALAQSLVASAPEGVHFQIINLDAVHNGLEQITQALAQYGTADHGVDAIHLITHADSGEMFVGSSAVTTAGLASDPTVQNAVAAWKPYLTADADILLYGCELAKGPNGQEFVDKFSALTGADVAASTNRTGSVAGADWTFETVSGSIETSVLTTDLSVALATTADPVATVDMIPGTDGIDGDASAMINEDFQFSVTFHNGGTAGAADGIGYAPYINLNLPSGIDLNSITPTYLNQPVHLSGSLATIVDPLGAPNVAGVGAGYDNSTGTSTVTFTHIYTGQTITVAAGEEYYVYDLPFGSFVPGQEPVSLLFTGHTDKTELTLAGVPLTTLPIKADGGFRFGTDPLNNPLADPLISGAVSTGLLTPTVWEVSKDLLEHEDETATGRNFPNTWGLFVDIASAEVLTGIVLTDTLPNNVVFLHGTLTINDTPYVYTVGTPFTAGGLTYTVMSEPADGTLGGSLVIQISGIVVGGLDTTGVTGAVGNDLKLTYQTYTPEFYAADVDGIVNDSILDPTSGAFSDSLNKVDGESVWHPNGMAGVGAYSLSDTDVADQALVNHDTLEDQSLAIQKGVTVNGVSNTGSVLPGDNLVYNLNFQVSDYFQFSDLYIVDHIGDGQSFFANFAGSNFNAQQDLTLSWVEEGVTYSATFTGVATSVSTSMVGGDTIYKVTYGNDFVAYFYDANSGTTPANVDGIDIVGGQTVIRFDLSSMMLDAAGADAILIGGYVRSLSSGTGTPSGGTQGSITYKTKVNENYVNPLALGGDASVDLDDQITNGVNMYGTVITWDRVGDMNAGSGGEVHDDSGTVLTVPNPEVAKEIYALNGTLFDPATQTASIAAGETVTYGVTLTLPTSDIENLKITDFIPLPKFDAQDLDSLTVVASSAFVMGTIPASTDILLVLPDTIYNAIAAQPGFVDWATWASNALDSSSTGHVDANSFSIVLGSFDVVASPADQQIKIYFTLTAKDTPMADGLLLTNQVAATYNDTKTQNLVGQDIVQVIIEEPVVDIYKGVIDSTKGATVTMPGAIGDVVFTATTNTTVNVSGVLDTKAEAQWIGDQDLLTGVLPDAGDTVRYAIVSQNTGRADAYNVTITDTVRDSYVNNYADADAFATATNFKVYDGAGHLLSSDTDGDVGNNNYHLAWDDATDTFTVTMLQSLNQGQTVTGLGTLGTTTVTTDGSNAIIVFYDLTVVSAAQASSTITNTATLASYTGIATGGTNHTFGITDDAKVKLAAPEIGKTLDATSVNTGVNNNTQAVIGEWADYTITITVSEGQTMGTVLSDVLGTATSGLAFVDFTGMTVSSGLAFSIDGVSFDSSTTSAANSTALHNLIGGGEVTVDHDGRMLTINFGNIANSNTDNAVAEKITISYRAVVLNVTGNTDGSTQTNTAVVDYRWTDDNGTATPPTGTDSRDATAGLGIITPHATIQKSAAAEVAGVPGAFDATGITGLDAGDTAYYQFVISNSAGSPTAYDFTFTDALPAHFVFGSIYSVTGTANAVALAAGDFTYVLGTNTISLTTTGLDLLAGDSVTLVVKGKLSDTVEPSEVIPNTGVITATTFDGNAPLVSTYNSGNPTENTEGTYGSSDDAKITVNAITAVKSVIATSETGTAGNTNVAVGEIVRYRLYIQVPESTIGDLSFFDALPLGLTFLNDGTATASFVSNSGITSTLVTDISAQTVGSTVTTPSYLLADGVISSTLVGNNDTYANGSGVYFKFGAVTNLDNDANAEYIVVEFNAIVSNAPGSSNNAVNASGGSDRGDTDTNTFTALNGSTTLATSNSVDVVIVEPVLGITNDIVQTTGDAGDVVTINMAVTNSGNATAYNNVVTNTLDPLKFDLTTLAFTDPAGYTHSVDLGTGIITWTATTSAADLAAAGVQNFSFTVALKGGATGVEPGETLASAAKVTYTSLAGSGETGDWTGTAATSSHASTAGGSTGERTGSGTAPNDYASTASDSFTLAAPSIVKSIISTGDANTGTSQYAALNQDLAIGEVVTYTITVTFTEGATTGVTISDFGQDNGSAILEILSAQLTSIGTNLSASGGTQSLVLNSTVAPTNSTGSTFNDQIAFHFGTILNSFDNAGTSADQLVITVTARIANSVVNQAGDTAVNTGRLAYTDGNGVAKTLNSTVTVDVVEPVVTVTKTPTTPITNLDAGDSVTYTVVLTNTGNAPAYDVSLIDSLPAGVTITSIGTPTLAGGASEQTALAGTSNLTGTFDIPIGGTVTFTYTVQLPDTVTPSQSLTSDLNVSYSSQDGVVAGERTGADVPDPENNTPPTVDSTLNNYAVGADAIVTMASPFSVEKSLINTSLGGDTSTSVVVGEVVTYQIGVTVMEGTTNNLSIIDTLPVGLTLVPGSVVISDQNGMTISGFTAALVGQTLTITATSVVNPGNADAAGTVDTDTFLITYKVQVQDVAGNQSGTTLTNDADATATGVTPDNDNQVTITVAEPVLTLVKTTTTTGGDAGDTVVYTLVITNSNAANTSTAYDINVGDLLDTDIALINAALGAGNGIQVTGATVTANTSTTGNLSLTLNSLAPGASATIILTAKVIPGAEAGSTVSNSASIDWSSLPSGHPDEGGERDGGGGVDDYTDSDSSADFILAHPAIDKVTPADTTYAIGEIVTYDILVTLPEGTVSDLIIRDNLPAGLVYTGFQVVTSAASSSLLTSDFVGTVTGTPTLGNPSGNVRTFDFGDVSITNDNIAGNNSFVLRVTARVDNILANQGLDSIPTTGTGAATTFSNTASLQYTDGTTGTTTVLDPTAPGAITVVEPIMTLDKTAVSGTTNLDAGDTIQYQIAFGNAATATSPAYDIILTDTLPSGLLVTTIDSITVLGGAPALTVADFVITGGGTGIALSPTYQGVLDLAAGQGYQLKYTVTLQNSVTPGTDYDNTAHISWTSIDGTNANERTGASDTQNGGGLNDYSLDDAVTATTAAVFDLIKGADKTTATIGEIITYTLTLTLNEGTTNGVQIVDTLPVTSGNLQLEFISATATISYGTAGSSSSGSVIPTVSGANSQTLTFNLGTVVVPADAAGNTVTITYQVRVTDVASNVGGVDLLNDADGSATGVTPDNDNVATVEVLEPNLTIVKTNDDLDKIVSPGETVIYTVNVANPDTLIGATAYNVSISDSIATGILSNLTISSVELVKLSDNTTTTLTGAGLGADYTTVYSTATGWQINLADGLDEGYGVRVTYSATFSTSGLTATMDNNTRVSFTSLPDATADEVRDYVPTGTESFNHTDTTTPDGWQDTERVTLGTGSIGNRVWFDLDADGIQDLDEVGLVGVTVTLTGFDSDGVTTYTRTTVTGVDGAYLFTGLAPGDYTVAVSLPPGGNITDVMDNGTITASTTSPTITISTLANDAHTDVDFGIRGNGSIGDLVWNNLDGDLVRDLGEPGIDGVLLNLIWDVNGNGVFDAGDTIIDTVTTATVGGVAGTYHFTDLLGGAYGNYLVQTDPSNYGGVLANGSTATYDKDDYAPIVNNGVATVALGVNENATDVDFGFTGPTGSVSDTVWYDVNGNGYQDAGEMGIGGVILFLDQNHDGIRDAFEAFAVTDANGKYVIRGLVDGAYDIRVVSSTLPGGAVATYDPDGLGTANVATFSILASADRTDMDFGYRGTGSIGDQVFVDTNHNGVFDSRDKGIGGVTITLTLLAENGRSDISLTTTTDSNGRYRFDGLFGGNYRVALDSSQIPSNLRAIYDLDGISSPHVAFLTLGIGETRMDADFAYLDPTAVFGNSLARSTGLFGISNATLSVYYQTTYDPTFDEWDLPAWELVDSTPIFSSPLLSGHAEPGSKLVLALYNHQGELLSTSTVLVASGGNWTVSFAGVKVNGPITIVSSVSASDFTSLNSDNNFNFRTNYITGLAGGYFQSRATNIDSAFSNLAYERMAAMVAEDEKELAVGWIKNDYEFLAEPGLPGGND